jgi:hypothetical protein
MSFSSSTSSALGRELPLRLHSVCAACGAVRGIWECETVGEVTFCPDCLEQSRESEFDDTYRELGGGD